MSDTHGEFRRGWVGVDLDGTLAEYHGWKGIDHIGEPIPRMVARVKEWIKEGRDVRIMTARATPGRPDFVAALQHISEWCFKHLGIYLPITHAKDMAMIELWDDRAVQIIPNTGLRADGEIIDTSRTIQFAAFGSDVMDWIKKRGGNIFCHEDSEELMELGHRYGLVQRVVYDPAKHGEIEEAEPGREIWFWGEEKTAND